MTFNENASLTERDFTAEHGKDGEQGSPYSSSNEQNEMSITQDEHPTAEKTDTDRASGEDSTEKANGNTAEADSERAEYERLIRTRFKELYAEDVQRHINRRFKKLRSLEQKVAELEKEAAETPDIESLLRAERERAVEETEQRMNALFVSNRNRPRENAVFSRAAVPLSDVSKLTRAQRASLAQRASRGEKIKF